MSDMHVAAQHETDCERVFWGMQALNCCGATKNSYAYWVFAGY
ncbi:hypothetical protein [Comamonas guangdongensis]|uniref:Uncharacterized protein n=1 Tax=Comamonas guangdongensis TaxID=510515 RepID=A0ABV3ZY34_9BURK